MKHSSIRRASVYAPLLLAALASHACTPQTQQPWPPIEPLYYVVEVEVDRASIDPGAPQRVELLDPHASERTRPGVRVAFYPPDSCITTTAAPEASAQSSYIQLQCGVLMSNLEASLASSGYQVISWQALRQGQGASVYDKARQLNVDVLFEIDQLSVNERGLGQTRATGLNTFFQSQANNRTPLPVTTQTGARCKQLADRVAADLSPQEASATLAVKAVDVHSGKAIWYYQKSIAEQQGGTANTVVREFYFEAPASRPPQPVFTANDQYNSTQRWGGILLGFGLGTTFVSGMVQYLISTGEPSSTDPFGEPTDETLEEPPDLTFFIVGGLVSAGIGSVLILVGNAEEPEEQDVPAPLYTQPDSVLCASQSVRPWFVETNTQSNAPQAPSTSASFRFQDSTASPADLQRRKIEKLFSRTASDFVREFLLLGNRNRRTDNTAPTP